MELSEIEKLLKSGKNLEEILKLINWKEFEEKIGEIFQAHGFKTTRNFRFKTDKKHEIDLIAERGNKVFVVDCKHWSRGRYKLYELKKAALKQKYRAMEFKKFIGKEKEIIPIVLTLYDEGVYQIEDIFIIPSFKLNTFLLEQ